MAGQPYLHLGGDVVVRTRDVVGIFDMEKTTESAIFSGCGKRRPRVYRVVRTAESLRRHRRGRRQ